jgi:L-malate glycosyltransferase
LVDSSEHRCESIARRVVYVVGQLGVGGTEKQLWHLVQGLSRCNWKPSVVCFSGEPEVIANFQKVDCPVTVIRRQSLGRLRTTYLLWQHLRTEKPEIVQAFGFAWYFAIPAARLASIPRIVISERTLPPWKKRAHLLLDYILLSAVDRAIVNSQRVGDRLISENGLRADRCRVIYNGLNLEDFQAGMDDGENLPSLQDGSTPQVICATANAKEDKGLDVLLKAFVIVRRTLPMAKLWIVGDGELRQDLESLASALGLNNQVVFWGVRSDVPAILRKATIGVNSSRTEGLCNAIMEYMAAGLPTVATSVGGNSELVVDGETGVLAPPDNPEALAGALIDLLVDRERASKYGKAARRRVEQAFTVPQMVKQTESVYNELY